MKTNELKLPYLRWIAFCLILGMSMNASAAGGRMSWKEEVLLHDGHTLIIQRSQTRDSGGAREIGQPPPLVEETARFTLPGTNQVVNWRSNFGQGLQDNLTLLLVGVLRNSAYIATYPTRCHAYERWERPNPPYVFFKFDGKRWQRIPISEFPTEFKEANVIVDGYNEKQLRSFGESPVPYVRAETIARLNRVMSPESKYLRVLVREPLNSARLCPEPRTGFKAPYPVPPKKATDGK